MRRGRLLPELIHLAGQRVRGRKDAECMTMGGVWDGIIIGGTGGAIAGLTVSFVRYVHTRIWQRSHKKRLYNWLKDNTSEEGDQFRSTRAIASWNNLTEDRVRYICSIHKKIFLSTGKTEDRWSLYEIARREGELPGGEAPSK